MPLIKSIAGVRGTIGGKAGESLTPLDVVPLTIAFAEAMPANKNGKKKMIIGRDARPSGRFLTNIVSSTLQSLGVDVIDIGLSTTPTVALAIVEEAANGGIVITASHNPAEWNALKLFNEAGEYINASIANAIFQASNRLQTIFADTAHIGHYQRKEGYMERHVQQVIDMPVVAMSAIKKRSFRVAIDTVNSTGGIIIPLLLNALGISYTELCSNPNGHFCHDPEPVSEHLSDLIALLKSGHYDIGLAVDPDVDRLVVIDEKGVPWGEDYTLVAAADYILSHQPGGKVVANLSSSSALKTITERHGGAYSETPVGEMHVVARMKEINALIGGEGNGGVIYPALHYGRDALAGIALILSHLAKSGKTASQLRASYPTYVMVKTKFPFDRKLDFQSLTHVLQAHFPGALVNLAEGIKMSLPDGWFHIRASNTEPIIRLHVEGFCQKAAHDIAEKATMILKKMLLA